jgi:hypothetical protein
MERRAPQPLDLALFHVEHPEGLSEDADEMLVGVAREDRLLT